MTKKLVMALIAVVLVGAGFFGGMTYQKSQTASGPVAGGRGNLTDAQKAEMAANGGVPGAGGPGATSGRTGGMASGTVVSVASDSLTIKLASGSSRTIYLADSTTYAATSADAKSKLVAGVSVSIETTTSGDVSTAESILVK